MSTNRPHTPGSERTPLSALVGALWPRDVIQHISPAQLARLAEAHLRAPAELDAPIFGGLLCHLERCEQCSENLFALIDLTTAELAPLGQSVPSPDLDFLERDDARPALPALEWPPRRDLVLQLVERAAILAQRSTVLAVDRLQATLARRLEQSRHREQTLGLKLDRMEALQEELEAQVLRLLEWTRGQLSQGVGERIWSMEWLPSSLRGSLIDLALMVGSLSHTVSQPIQEFLLTMRLNRVKMRRTVLERDLERTQAQQVALEMRLEQMRAEAGLGDSAMGSPIDRAWRP